MRTAIFQRVFMMIAVSLLFGGCYGQKKRAGQTEYLVAPVVGSETTVSTGSNKVRGMPAPRVSGSPPRVSSSLRRQILALNPDRISEADIQRVLSKAPAPQVIGIHGGIFPVHLMMKDFSNFLAAMGYPKNQTRLPGGLYSYSPYRPSGRIAGAAAWYYEQTGMRVLMVGHSQGGLQLMKVLHDLSGTYGESAAERSFNPVTNKFEDRTTFRDPQTGRMVSLQELKPVYYATAVAAGGATQAMPNQWGVSALARKVPDATKAFTGYSVPGDVLGGGLRAYRATGRATVRNVVVKWGSEHLTVPRAHRLAKNATSRAWINSWNPSVGNLPPSNYKGPRNNLLYAANVWYEIKKYWCLSLQEAVR